MDDGAGLSSQAEGHFSTCDECACFRESTLAIERRYRIQVRTGIDRLRRLAPMDPPSFRPRRALQARLLIPLAAAVLVCGWGLVKQKPAVPASAPFAEIATASPTKPPPHRSLLFDGFLEGSGPELSFLRVGEPALPVRLDQDLHGIGGSDFEISLPRDLKF
jgi:hypothetical protein